MEATGVNALVGVDLVQTLSGHFNGHNGLIFEVLE